MHKSTYEPRHALGSTATLCSLTLWSVPKTAGLSPEQRLKWGRSLWGFAQVQALPHPLNSILSITTGKELIAMAAPDPWPPIGSLVAMGYGAISRPPVRSLCVKGVPHCKGPLCSCPPRCTCLWLVGTEPLDLPGNRLLSKGPDSRH